MEGTEMNKKGCRGWEGMRRNMRDGKMGKGSEGMGMTRDRKGWEWMENIGRDPGMNEKESGMPEGWDVCIGRDRNE